MHILDELACPATDGASNDNVNSTQQTVRTLPYPSRMRGCGLRDRRLVAHIAFVSCFVEVAEQLVTPTGGFFPMLTRISPHDFDPVSSGMP